MTYVNHNGKTCALPQTYEQSPEVLSRLNPHVPGSEDAYFVGTAYDDQPPAAASEWELVDLEPRPYLKHVKAASNVLPHLRYLADWMEVSCAPVKWNYVKLRQSIRAERAARTHVCMVDFQHDQVHDIQRFNTIDGLKTALTSPKNGNDNVEARVFIVEDLSRDTIEMFGSRFGIDPSFFRGHISDYLWYNTRDRWAEIPQLPSVARRKPYFQLQYSPAWYFHSRDSFERAKLQAGHFNVLRRFDRDYNEKRTLDAQNAFIAIMRSKVSLWIRPNKGGETGVLAVLLVDPTTEGHPLWGGHRNYYNCPEPGAPISPDSIPPRSSFFEEVVYGIRQSSKDDLESVAQDSKSIALPLYRIILAEWLSLTEYISARLEQIYWELERPNLERDPTYLDSTLQKLHFWRRHVSNYCNRINDSINSLFSPEDRLRNDYPSSGTLSLLEDFKSVLARMDSIQTRIERIVAMASIIVSLEESRRSQAETKVGIEQNEKLAVLTNLATIFIPMSFFASFFSMTSDISSLKQTYWIYFVVALPVTALSLVLIDFMGIRRRIGGRLGFRRQTKAQAKA